MPGSTPERAATPGADAAAGADSAATPGAARVTALRNPLVECADGRMPVLPRSAWLEIDLDALVSNVRLIASLLPAGSRVEPVVKADAYGHGAVAVSRALVADGIASLSVATFDEAVELRQAGIEVPIAVLFPIPPALAPEARRLGLSVTAGDTLLLSRMLEALAEAEGPAAAEGPAGATGAATTLAPLAIQVEIESGLGRGGVPPEAAADIARRIAASPHARLAGVWSHLQAADDAGRTEGQRGRFDRAWGLLDAAGFHIAPHHLAATGGVLRGAEARDEVVRIGIAQHGLVPDGLAVSGPGAEVAARLRPVMSLRARPVRVADLPAGSGVSYGPTFTTSRPSRIATLPVGYADGYPRAFSNRAQVLVRGMRVPQVGTVAMDAVMVDVTDVPGPAVSVDDEFTLLGRQGEECISATEMARWGATISYEVLAGMSARLPRVYYAAARTLGVRTVAMTEEGGGRG
jgi:alanine racemase